MKKQLREATATVFRVGWKSRAVVFFTYSTDFRGATFPEI